METVMTYEQWEHEYKKRSQKEKAKRKYFAIQKTLGALLLVTSIIATALIQDGTHLLVTVPLGISLLLSRKRLLTL